MKLVILVILLAILGVITVQVYFLFKERNQLKADIGILNAKLGALIKENNSLRSEIEYFSHPENLEKELKSKFNYKHPDEKMLIIVP